MQLIDLSTPVDARLWEPEPVRHEPMTPAQGAKHMTDAMREHFGLELSVDELPEGEFLNNDTFTLTAHTGTHVDAPAHYGTRTEYGTGVPRTIDEMPIDWFVRPGFVLDLSAIGSGAATAQDVESALDRIGYNPKPFDIALLHTGAASRAGTPEYFTKFVGLDGSATDYLLDFGVKVIGTDGFSLDAPFTHIIGEYQRTGDRGVLWPAHFTGRRREYCQIERLNNLDQLPAAYGFYVSCLPVKLTGAGAGWTRAVAVIGDLP